MAFARSTVPITEGDEVIERALQDAHLPALLPAVAQAMGDYSILRDDLRPTVSSPPLPQGGLSYDQQDRARAICMDALRALRDSGGGSEAERIQEDDLRTVLRWMTGTEQTEEYLPLVVEELAPPGQDPRAPDWRLDPDTQFRVIVVGAGMSGILAGIRLKQAGVPFEIIEKNDDVGGTWLENTYPGARVDVSNAFYSYSFAQRTDWPKHFSTQQVLLDYFRDCAREYGIIDHIRFRTEVERATYDEQRAIWSLRLRGPGNVEETIEANALISAVGQLNRPKAPEIPGLDTFSGPQFHSARWDHDVDLKGKRIAVIGNGASAAQLVPEIAPDVAHLTVFQRTPNWFFAVPHYHDDVPEGQQWLFTHVPYYAHWYRFWLFWGTVEGLVPTARVDDGWPDLDRSVGERNEMLRRLLAAYIERQYEDRPDLLEKVMPQYPPAAKRIILDNGAWAEALKRDNVTLVTDSIRQVTPTGVVTEDGVEHPADVLIYATGFHASKFLSPMRIAGRGGVDLHERWNGDARAYMGITVPDFPNFFILYGPNTNIVVNGSIIYFSECEVQYVMGCIRLLTQGEHRAMDCRHDVHDRYNEWIDQGNRKMVWGVSKVNSWYKNEKGRVAQNWPFTLLEYWQQTREPDPADYELV